jgi:Protein of unknown function (DUF3618)
MTTSGRAGESAGRHAADPATSPGINGPAEHAPDDGAPQTARQADAETGPPDDVQELQQEIEQTREQLGETVEQLVAKADVKARARDKAAELTGRVNGKASQARTKAAARAGSVRDQFAGKTGAARQKAMAAGGAGKDQLQRRAAAVAAPVWQATPEPVRQAVATGASSARQRRVPLAAAVAALVAGYLAIRWWMRR